MWMLVVNLPAILPDPMDSLLILGKLLEYAPDQG